MFVGDSITYHLSVELDWDSRAVWIASPGTQVMGVAQVAIPAVASFLAGNNPQVPRVARAVILLGTNDFDRQVRTDQFRRAYAQLVAGVEVFMPVLCVLPLPRQDENEGVYPLQRYRDQIRLVCGPERTIDPREAIPEWTPELFDGAVHPNAAGNAILWAWLAQKTGGANEG